ncbi:MAG TPA: hypothetical protein VGN18_04890 [Jatrophihabitans sp.]|uniref:hypothetical protein n=1 Tax=Jatrophihabitans sp. TaxID=1932789 RepID=UPI002E05637D|nr:hypothetical protein [Jatrophihabitans sp.]
MTALDHHPAGADDDRTTSSSAPASTLDAPEDRIPRRAADLQLIGEMPGSGYRAAPSLVRRGDGQTLQLTALLYLVLESIDGTRDYAEVAEVVSERFGRLVTGDQIQGLVDGKLRPLGVVCKADGSEPEVRKANPLLALRFRAVVSDPAVTRRITAPFARLFNPLVVVAVLVAFVLVCKWVLFDRGLGFAAHQAFARPGLLLTVFAITVVSAGFHEFGHAAAARYGGATPGAMGAGLYLVWPAFYTDVTDSYRLGRAGRLRTDLGGLYFNALLSVVMFGLWAVTGWDALLLVIGAQIIQMVRQLPPMVRFDGYHILADLTGVPDLFHRIKPTLAGLNPRRWGSPESKVLKPWAKAVVTVWVLLVVPLMVLTVLVTLVTLPRVLASAAASVRTQWTGMWTMFGDGDVPGGLAKLLGVIAVGLPIFGIAYILTRSVKQLARKVWTATAGQPVKRAVALVVAAAVVAALAFVWWPRGNYRVIQYYERGTVQDAVAAAFHPGSIGAGSASGLAVGRQASATTVWPAGAGALPTRQKPALSLVLVPRSRTTPAGTPAPTWVFPFNRPRPPGLGDNQSLAVNTKDGSVVYDVAFAMVWADHDTVLNKNEAYAFSSCRNCRTTAVSFQIVLIVGHASVVVPQNIAGSVNYNCISCLTQALALQLAVTLPNVPGTAETHDITELWRQIYAFSKTLTSLPFTEIQQRLADYEKQMLAVIDKYAPPKPAPTGAAASTTAAPSAPSGAASTGTGAGPGDPSDPAISTAPAVPVPGSAGSTSTDSGAGASTSGSPTSASSTDAPASSSPVAPASP